MESGKMVQDNRWNEIVDIVYEVMQEAEAEEFTPLEWVQRSLDKVGIQLNEAQTKDVIYIVAKVSETTDEMERIKG